MATAVESSGTTIIKHQELQVLAMLTKAQLEFHYDTSRISELQVAGIQYRPDFVVRLKNVVVIVEVDEDGHVGYDATLEIQRMQALWNAFDKRVGFLRVYVERSIALSGVQLNRLLYSLHALDALTYDDTHMKIVLLDYPIHLTPHYRDATDCIKLVQPQCMVDPTKGGVVLEAKPGDTVTLMSHICPRCGAGFTYRSFFIRHLENTRSCPPLRSTIPAEDILRDMNIQTQEMKDRMYRCSKCHKGYSHKRSAVSHEKKCTVIAPPPPTTTNNISVEASPMTLEDRVAQLEKQLKELQMLLT